MDVTADTLLNQVSTILLDKIDRQNIDPNFLKGFLNTLLSKFVYKETGPIKQQPQVPASNATATKGIVEDFKKAYKEILKDASYVNDYKEFLKKVLPSISTQKENIVANVPSDLATNITNVNNNIYNEENYEENRPDLVKTTSPLQTINNTYNQENYEEKRVDLIKEKKEPLIVRIDGLTSKGYEDLKEKLPKILKDLIPKPKEEKKQEKDSKSLFEQFSGIASLLSGLSKVLGRAIPAITSMLGKAAPLLAKIAGPIAAIAGGEFIGGQIGKMIGSNETVSNLLYGSPTAGKEAYEKYGTGITGLGRALYDSYQQGIETKEQQKEHQRMSQERIKKSGESLAGKTQYDPNKEAKLVQMVEELREREKKFKEQYEELKSQALEGWNPLHDEQKETEARMNWKGIQESLTIAQNRLAEFRKLKNENISTPKQPPVALAEGGVVTKPTNAIVGEAGPEAVVPLDKIFDSKGTSLNNITLDQIASNTKNTNQSLGVLADAIIKMIGAFNQKMSTQGSTTIINTGGSKDSTSASLAANFNADPIRRVRSQFAV